MRIDKGFRPQEKPGMAREKPGGMAEWTRRAPLAGRVVPAYIIRGELPDGPCKACAGAKKAHGDALEAYAEEAIAHRHTQGLLEMEIMRTRMLEARLASKMLLVAGMVHDLKNPLTITMGATAVLKENLDAPVRGAMLEMLESGHGKMLSITNLALDFFQAEAGRLRVEPKALDLAAEAAGVAGFMRPMAADRRLAVETAMEGPVYAEADTRLLHHVAANLISNAIKYNREGGKVTVSAALMEGRAVLRVSDTGVGIGRGELPCIFNPYERGEWDGKGDGRGLGLMVVRKFTELMGGTVEVQSEPGAGSTFSVWLPAAEPPAQENARP